MEKAVSLQAQGLDHGVLDNTPFKEWEVFIDSRPAHCIYKTVLNIDSPVLAGNTIYVGWNE